MIKKNKKSLFKQLGLCLILMGILCMLSSCNKVPLDEDIAKKTIKEEYAALLNYDSEENNILTSTLYEGFDVEIQSIKKSENGYVVKCKLSNYDIKAAFEQLQNQADEIDYNEFEKRVTEIFKECGRVKSTTELTIIQNEDEKYTAQFNEEQFDQAMGGFISYYDEWVVQK